MKYIILPLLVLLCSCATKTPVASVPAATLVLRASPVASSGPLAQPTRPAAVAATPPDSTNEVVLSKETLGSVKQEVPVATVTLTKVISYEQASIPVQLRTESYEVVRTAPNGQAPDFAPQSVKIELSKETASASITATPVEVVTLRKTISSEGATVTGQLRSETAVVTKVP